MWAKLEPWQLLQLQRLAKLDPERVESLMNALFLQYPGLYAELAIAAVDQEQLTVEACADRLNLSEDVIERRRAEMHRRMITPTDTAIVVQDGTKPIARLAEGHIAVWEVVREYRKVGSVEALRSSFPGVSEVELASALRYAQDHPAEIQSHIDAFERLVALKRSEYPFAS